MKGGIPDVQREEWLMPNVTDKESDDGKLDQLGKATIRQVTQEAGLWGNEETIVDY